MSVAPVQQWRVTTANVDAERATAPVAEVVALVRAVQQRTAFCSFPPVALALARGEVPRLTRRGWRIYYQHAAAFRVPVDARAVEAEIALRPELFRPAPPLAQRESTSEGMNLTEAARWAGVSRQVFAQSVVDVVPGELPTLAIGEVPVRRIGNTRRFFPKDLLGDRAEKQAEVRHGSGAQEASSGSGRATSWDRQVDLLRRRRAERG